ncbi:MULTISPECIES: hypothetical protein [unclassified Streptomyces]|uniref:hypothetical protein n=1 Tax=unclassified Streptomyces TaxID=2593676 RepID=UPI0019085707|nr:hypothetical protein [Streptomyces sp. HSG2]
MSGSSKRYPATELRPRTVVGAVAAQVWPLSAFLGALMAAALVWFARSGDRGPVELTWALSLKPATLGLIASFALHEVAHVVVLKRVRTVTHIVIERGAWRTSVIPEGGMTARQAAVVALAGPLSCVVVGALLTITGVDRSLAWWYLAHAAFLLPFFGDGRALLGGLRAGGRGHPGGVGGDVDDAPGGRCA